MIKPKETEVCSCTENWICDEWNECIDGKQTKNCIDANGCGTAENREEVERNCGEKNNLIYFVAVIILILVVAGIIIGRKGIWKKSEEKFRKKFVEKKLERAGKKRRKKRI